MKTVTEKASRGLIRLKIYVRNSHKGKMMLYNDKRVNFLGRYYNNSDVCI